MSFYIMVSISKNMKQVIAFFFFFGILLSLTGI